MIARTAVTNLTLQMISPSPCTVSQSFTGNAAPSVIADGESQTQNAGTALTANTGTIESWSPPTKEKAQVHADTECVPCKIQAARIEARLEQLLGPAIPKLDWFFADPANVRKLMEQVRSWLGTPFSEQACLRGVGADCVRFAEAVYVAVGAMQPVNWPPYSVFGGGTDTLRTLARCLREVPKLVCLPELKGPDGFLWEHAMPGDLILHSSGKAFHHLAIFEKYPTIWHCLNIGCSISPAGKIVKTGVQDANVTDPTCKKHAKALYRFIK